MMNVNITIIGDWPLGPRDGELRRNAAARGRRCFCVDRRRDCLIWSRSIPLRLLEQLTRKSPLEEPFCKTVHISAVCHLGASQGELVRPDETACITSIS